MQIFYVFDAYSYSGNSYKAWTLWDVSSVPQFGGILNSEINMYLNGTGSTSITETITVNNVTTSYGNYSGYNAAYIRIWVMEHTRLSIAI